jgi:hypothetical protein
MTTDFTRHTNGSQGGMLLESRSGIWLVGVSERPIQAIRIRNEEDAEEDAAAVDEGRVRVEGFDACDTRRLCAW